MDNILIQPIKVNPLNKSKIIITKAMGYTRGMVYDAFSSCIRTLPHKYW